jgi:hypothetical protein
MPTADYRDKGSSMPVKPGNGGPMDGQHPTSDNPKPAPKPSRK